MRFLTGKSFSTIFALIFSSLLFYCSDDFTDNLEVDEFTDEEKIWLADDDGDGEADSLALYTPDCELELKECIVLAQENKVIEDQRRADSIAVEEKRIADSLFLPVPLFSVDGGTYDQVFEVVLSHAKDATIRYTTNGTIPTDNSLGYTDPIPVNNNMILIIRAFATGSPPSEVDSAIYVFKTAAPSASIKGGDHARALELVLTSASDGAVIYYTLDGSDPSESSTKFTSAITIEATSTLKARAFVDEWSPSDLMQESYTITIAGTVAGVVFSPEGATYNSIQQVSLTSATESAEIRFEVDGSEPDTSSPVYDPANAIEINKSTAIKALAFKEGLKPSVVSVSTYLLQPRTPEFSLDAGSYTSTRTTTISVSAQDDASIYYTIDGSEPGESSLEYTGAIDIDQSVTLKAAAFKTGWEPSVTAEAEYTISIAGQVAGPVFSPPGGLHITSVPVSISSATQDAVIYYTLDGTTPTESSELYTSAILVDANLTIRAIATKTGLEDSPVSPAVFTIKVANPSIAPDGGTFSGTRSVVITTTTPSAEIYYTLDGTAPTESSSKYTNSISVSESLTLKARAFRTGREASDIDSAVFVISDLPQVTTPVFSPEGGTFNEIQSVTITSATEEATIHYTTGGATPTIASTLYTGAISVTSTQTLNAIAFKQDFIPSEIAEATFTITVDKNLTVVAPNGGEELVSGTSFNITWSSAGDIQNVGIEYTMGADWINIISSTANDQIFEWALPNEVSSTVKIRITEADGDVTDESDADFSLVAATDNNANLAGLILSDGSLTPAFSSDVTSYTVSVENDVTGITLTPSTSHNLATVTVNGFSVISGSASGIISLDAGENVISVQVTALDANTTITYTVTVTREAPPILSTDADLTGLTLSEGSLTPAFASGTMIYTSSVDFTTLTVTVTPTASSSAATILVNGATIASGATSVPIPLNEGANAITVQVTAEDGITVKAYTVTLTRAEIPGGLVAHWNFNDGSGTTLTDLSGFGNHGIISGATWVTDGIDSGALSFDGVDDFVDCGNGGSLDITTNLSMGLWIKKAELNTNGVNENGETILSKYGTGDDFSYSLQVINGDSIYFNFRTHDGGSSGHTQRVAPSIIDHTWHYIAVTYNYDSGVKDFYYDGQNIMSDTFNGIMKSHETNFYIGDEFRNTRFFKGTIDDVKIFNRVLSPAEITAEWDKFKDHIPTSEGLVAFYPFSGNANDASGNGNDGTVTGPILTTDRFGNSGGAYSFDGVDDFIDIEEFAYNRNNVFSVSFWFRPDELTLDQYLINFGILSESGQTSTIQFNDEGNNLIAYSVHGQGVFDAGTQALSANNYYHITFIHNSNTDNVKIYVNTTLDLDVEQVDFLPQSATIRLGYRREPHENASFVNGVMDDIRIYDRELTISEIQVLFNEGGWTGE